MALNQALLHYAYSSLTKRALEDEKEKKTEEKPKKPKLGPYKADRAADVSGVDRLLASNAYNERQHPGHWRFNPFIPGLGSRLQMQLFRRRASSAGNSYPEALVHELGSAGATPTSAGEALVNLFGATLGSPEKRDMARQQFREHLVGLPVDSVPEKRAEEEPDKENEEKSEKPSRKKTGPWQSHMSSGVVARDDALAAMQHNRQHNPGHYYLNPFVRGPLRELLTRVDRRALASSGNSTMEAAAPSLGAALGGATGALIGAPLGGLPGAGIGAFAGAGLGTLGGYGTQVALGSSQKREQARQRYRDDLAEMPVDEDSPGGNPVKAAQENYIRYRHLLSQL